MARWWGEPEKVLPEVLARPGEGGGDALIEADGVPVGYVRWQHPTRAELDEAGLHDVPESVIDIDIGIGEASRLGRGIGAEALRQVLGIVRQRKGVPLVMICTSVENEAALRCYRKAGFAKSREFDDPEYGRMLLLTVKAG